MNICTMEGCTKPVHGYGLCKVHYTRVYLPTYQRDYWQRTNAERRKKCSVYSQSLRGKYRTLKATARKKNYIISLSFEDFVQFTEKPCHYCGVSFVVNTGYGIDRKDNNIGYILDNCVSCCSDCNYLKGASLTYFEMLALTAFRKEYLIADRLVSGC